MKKLISKTVEKNMAKISEDAVKMAKEFAKQREKETKAFMKLKIQIRGA